MAYLDENATWEQGIYQWETQDPVVGGPDGIDNVPTRQLANRTGYLKEQIAAHAAATDPHPQYTTESEVQSQLAAHTAASDPHPQYTTESEVHALVEVTQPQFDSTKKPASTEFVQRALGNCQGVLQVTAPGTTTLTAANVGQFIDIYATGNVVIGLPQSVQCKLGATLLVTNYGSQAATVNPYAGDSINNTSALGSVSIAVNGTGLFINQGGGMWRLAGGDALLPSSGMMSGANFTTAAQFDNTTKLATTAFVQRALGNRSDIKYVTATATLLASDWGKLIPVNCTASGQVITLPAGSAGGTQMQFQNWGSYEVTITAPAGVLIDAGGNTASLILHASCSCTITWDGANYFMEGVRVGEANQFANNSRISTTSFVQRALGNYAGVSVYTAGATMVATDWGKVVLVNSSTAGTITMPAITNVPAGTAITVWNYGSANISLASPTDNTYLLFVYGTSTTATPYVLYPGAHVTIVYNVANLWVFDNLYSVTPALFDNTHRTATTEFVQRAIGSYNGITGISSATTLTATQAGQPIMCYSGATIVLPVISKSGIISGTMYHLCATTTTGVSTSGESITYGSGGAISSFTLYAGEDAILVTNGASWYLVGGSAASRLGPRQTASKATSGYQALPSGVIIQWGKSYAPDDSYTAITFPATFPNACWSVTTTPETTGVVTGANAIGTFVGGVSASGCSIGTSLYNTAPSTGYVYWFAIVY